jgi:hypothetical protein
MSDKKQRHQHPVQTNPHFDKEPVEKDKDDVDSEKWNPTREGFEAFLTRDEELAVGNIRRMLTTRPDFSLRDLRESCLHSNDTIDRVLGKFVQDGQVQETKGRYSLVHIRNP